MSARKGLVMSDTQRDTMDVYFRGILSSLRYAKDYAIAAGAYVLASKTHRRALVDTGEPNIEKYLSELKSVLTRHNAEIDSIIITHSHHDHVGGINSVIKHVIGHEFSKVPIYKIYREGDGNLCKFEYIVDGHEIRIEGATIRFIQTPGHTSDHTSLWLEEENALFRMKREIEILDTLRDLGIASSMDITNKVYADTPMSVRIAALNNVELHLTKLIKDEKVEEIGFHLYKIAD
uniref:Lactamase_B domain-containing protein n=1 Tax=Heterorhabditis bacteriophora TaxID=37862 RepID=A0A1I7XCC2_HETBA